MDFGLAAWRSAAQKSLGRLSGSQMKGDEERRGVRKYV